MSDIGPLFVLQFDNKDDCDCGAELLEGNRGAFVDGELQCEECVTELQTEETNKFTRNWGKKK